MKTSTKLILLFAIMAGALYTTPLIAMNTNTNHEKEVKEVITSIFRATDQRNWSEVEYAFADRVKLDYTSLAGGEPATLTPSEITSQWRGLLPGFDYTYHALGDFEVEIKGRKATAHHSGAATHYLKEAPGAPIWIVAGTYDYALEQQNGQWKVKEMTFHFSYMDGNANLLRLAQEKVKGNPAYGSSEAAGNMVTVDAFFARLEEMDIDSWITLWHPEGRQIMPFSPEGFPKELSGREAIYNQYKGMPDNYESMTFERTLMPMADPNMVVVKYNGTIRLANGGDYNNTYIGLFEVHDGKIMSFTEYFDPIILQKAFGSALQENFNVSDQ